MYPETMRRRSFAFALMTTVAIGGTQCSSAPPPTQPAVVIPTTGEFPYQVGGDVTAPRVIKRVAPQQLPGNHQWGSVIVKTVIGVDGVPRDVSIVKADRAELGAAAVAALQQWRFEPGKLRGEPVPVLMQLTVTFH